MRFTSLTAIAFGPFKDRRIDLAPGMTIVGGPNGAGKSSWHAALYAGLCGMRRGGGVRREDSDFADRHRPWGDEHWATVTEIVRDNGQRVELRYDFDGRVDCSATDLDFGWDLSGEIISDGMPDGSKFVGLDRQTFIRTACVGQAEILDVVHSAGELQEYLQRAAASADRDATASKALSTIKEFSAEFVGVDRKNSTKPLRAAKEALESRKAELAAAHEAHERYLGLLGERDRLNDEAQKLERESALADALATRAEAQALAAKVTTAKSLSAELGSDRPANLEDDQELADDVASVLSRLRDFPDATVRGEDPSALRAELAALPQRVEGETTPDPAILDTHRSLAEAEAASAEHTLHKRAPVEQSPIAVKSPASAARWLWPIAGLAFAGAIASLFLYKPIFTAAMVGALVLLSVLLVLELGRTTVPTTAEAQDSAETAGWESRAKQHQKEIQRLQKALRSAFESRGYPATNNLAVLYKQYVDDCATRNKNAAQLARKPDLERRLETAESLERQHADYSKRRAELDKKLGEVAHRCGVSGTGEELFAGLRDWQKERTNRLRQVRGTIAKWEELRGLLHGGTLDSLESEALTKARESDDLIALVAPGELEAFELPNGTPSTQDLRLLRESATAARSAAQWQSGELDPIARALPNVAEAKEALSQAGAELERLERLRETLATAQEFLERAQETVHRNIAPVLVATLEKWLPLVTNGLYKRATVDPETLNVRVRGENGEWRDATLLSHGTAEQIYLLLRIAMVDHLTKGAAETCPLLLDDVTAHCDEMRTAAILNLLHGISEERQVIVFSQQSSVLTWAAANLDPERDRMEILDETLIRA